MAWQGWAGGGATVAVAAVGAYLLFVPERPMPKEDPETAAAITPQTGSDDSGPPGDTADAGAAGALRPSFDLVRVDSDGNAIVAGSAPAGYDVAVEVDGVEVSRAQADDLGFFAVLFTLESSDAVQIIDLVATGKDGVRLRSDDSAIVTPRPGGAGAQAVASVNSAAPATEHNPHDTSAVGPAAETLEIAIAPLAAPEVDDATATDSAEVVETALLADGAEEAQVAPEASASSTTPADTAAASPGEAAAPAESAPEGTDSALAADAPAPGAARLPAAEEAPAVLLTSRDGVDLLQPAGASEAQFGALAIDAISYAEDGAVELTGHASNAAGFDLVRVYLDNAAQGDATVAGDGGWQMTLAGVAPGRYTLRADQVDAAGKVAARFETPFQRAAPAALAGRLDAAPDDGGVAARAITVQPGFTLWGIASDRYGDGLAYVQIFSANAALIRNPDLIYPGQVFELPELPAAATSD